VDTYTELDATFWGQSGIALDHRRLYLDGTAHSIHNAPELGERAVELYGNLGDDD
jgi:hypothetical protein